MNFSGEFFVVRNGQKIRIVQPEDVIPCLAAKHYHWREGFSAYELSYRWLEAQGFPPTVQAVLSQSAVLHGLQFREAFFEYQVNLGTPGHPSQTDLMVFADGSNGPVVIAVEGKVLEGFGPIAKRWNSTDGRRRRLESLCDQFDPPLFYDDAMYLNYQLLHRTASAVIEAKSRGLRRAVMLVHSFDPRHSDFYVFHEFADYLGMMVDKPGSISGFIKNGDIELALAWVPDSPRGSRQITVEAAMTVSLH